MNMRTQYQLVAESSAAFPWHPSSLFQPRFHLTLSALVLAIGVQGAVTIHDAAKAGDAATVRAILQTNAAAALLTNSCGETALHLGARAASPAVVEALLAAKAPVNAQAQGGMALHYALLHRLYPVFAALTNLQEMTHFAAESLLAPEIRTLADRGAPPVDGAAIKRNLSALADPAQSREELKVVERLLAAGADPNAHDRSGLTPVHAAAFRRQPEFLKAMLEKEGNILAQTILGDTPLDYAVGFGSPATVKLLLENGAKVGKANRYGCTPIFVAIGSGTPEIVRLLLDHGASADHVNHDGEAPLHMAARLQEREMVALLLDQGHAAINQRAGSLSETALHVAASWGDAAMVRLLLKRKADPNAADKEAFTPLLNAAEHGYIGIVEILVQKGADLTARTRKDSCAFALAAGSTNHALVQWLAEKLPTIDSKDKVLALQTASMHGRLANVRWLLEKGVPAGVSNFIGTPLLSASGGPGMIARLRQQKDPALNSPGDEAGSEADYAQIVSLLLTNGADVNFAGPEGRRPLHNATTCGSVLITETLLHHKADLHARTSFGKTPLHQAAAWGDGRLVELLLNNGAVLEARDNDTFTPLRDAAATGNGATIKVLLAHGAAVSVQDRYGATPLHWAAMTTNAAAAALLVDGGAAINALDVAKRTPLHQAVETGRDAMVQFLVEHKADTTATDMNFDTPAELARKKGFFHIVALLSGQSQQPSKPKRE